jgi:hypothetical protein
VSVPARAGIAYGGELPGEERPVNHDRRPRGGRLRRIAPRWLVLAIAVLLLLELAMFCFVEAIRLWSAHEATLADMVPFLGWAWGRLLGFVEFGPVGARIAAVANFLYGMLIAYLVFAIWRG